jgi:hypothetical protein
MKPIGSVDVDAVVMCATHKFRQSTNKQKQYSAQREKRKSIQFIRIFDKKEELMKQPMFAWIRRCLDVQLTKSDNQLTNRTRAVAPRSNSKHKK